MRIQQTRCCVVGGGPAGMMLGLLLARQGVDAIVLEKHADFLRDFRGDTVHPSTLELIFELGWLEEFLRLPHTKLKQVTIDVQDRPVTFADFARLSTRCRYVAFMPQWDFLDFLADKGRQYAGFRVVHRAEATELLEEAGRVVGVRAQTPDGPLDIRADLVVGADGRHSTVRDRAGMTPTARSAPMDVLWFRLPRHPNESQPFFHSGPGRVLICIDRGGYWQIAYLVSGGTFSAVRSAGLDAFRADITTTVPSFGDRVNEIGDWNEVRLLSVQVNRLRRWYRPGLLCIGDAAHAMSPAGGVGINLAIQDAVASANVLGPAFNAGTPNVADLRRIQRRRQLPTRLTQAVQARTMRGLHPKNPHHNPTAEPPLAFRLFRRFPALRHLTGYFIGQGFRPEHIRA